jgi:thiamine-monophosphate kinase
LLGDLGHVLRRSGVGADVHADTLPLGPDLSALPTPLRRMCSLAGGDDYELLFTAAPAQAQPVQAAAAMAQTRVTRIGCITQETGLRLWDGRQQRLDDSFPSFDHFRS